MKAANGSNVTKPRGKPTARRHGVQLREYVALLDLTQCLLEAYDHVARRAYGIYLERGSEEGKELDDWLRAERELLPNLPVDFQESEKCIHALAEVPGFDGTEVAIAVESRWLLIRAVRRAQSETKIETANDAGQRPADMQRTGNGEGCGADTGKRTASDENSRLEKSRGSDGSGWRLSKKGPRRPGKSGTGNDGRELSNNDITTDRGKGRECNPHDEQPGDARLGRETSRKARLQRRERGPCFEDKPTGNGSSGGEVSDTEGSAPEYMLSIFELTAEVDPMGAVAILSDGLLGIRIPKTSSCEVSHFSA